MNNKSAVNKFIEMPIVKNGRIVYNGLTIEKVPNKEFGLVTTRKFTLKDIGTLIPVPGIELSEAEGLTIIKNPNRIINNGDAYLISTKNGKKKNILKMQ